MSTIAELIAEAPAEKLRYYLLTCGHVQSNLYTWKPGTQLHCHQTGRGYGHLGTIVRRVRRVRAPRTTETQS